MPVTGKKIAILVEDLYQDLEVWYPILRLREAGAAPVSIGPVKKEFKGKNGYPLMADAGIGEVAAKDFDGLVIPGGYAPDRIRLHEPMIQFVREIGKAGKPIAAICHAGWVLCSTPELIRGNTVTSYVAIKDDLVNAGAKWIDTEVHVDGNLVTSRKPDDLPAFMREFLRLLGGA